MFCWWWIWPALKYFKVPKYYDQYCLKVSFLLSTLSMRIQISAKSAHLALKSYFYQKNYQYATLKAFQSQIFDCRLLSRERSVRIAWCDEYPASDPKAKIFTFFSEKWQKCSCWTFYRKPIFLNFLNLSTPFLSKIVWRNRFSFLAQYRPLDFTSSEGFSNSKAHFFSKLIFRAET